MAPLIVLVVVTTGLRAAGATGVHRLRSWPVALRGGLAAMFAVTGVSHFAGMRQDMIAMVPPELPAPGVLVTVTGLLELAGAVGLVWRRTTPWAAGGLSLLLVAMFPANAHAATAGVAVNGAPAMALGSRTLLQLVFLTATTTTLLFALRRQRSREPSPVGPTR